MLFDVTKFKLYLINPCRITYIILYIEREITNTVNT